LRKFLRAAPFLVFPFLTLCIVDADAATQKCISGSTVSEKPLAESDFWAIVERTTATDSGKQLSLLSNEMESLSAHDILAFHRTFNLLQQRVYTWDLWGAAYVINGGASDDSFDYFRSWLISRGQKTFELALRNADDLANAIPDGENGEAIEFEQFMDPAWNAWERRTGGGTDAYIAALDEMSACDATPAREPSGERFQDNEHYFAARYPKLWARFGKHPRG
jgi:hypothetical protein